MKGSNLTCTISWWTRLLTLGLELNEGSYVFNLGSCLITIDLIISEFDKTINEFTYLLQLVFIY